MADITIKAESLAFPVVLGDIGGTNARFAVIDAPGAEPQLLPHTATGDFPDIQSAMASALQAGRIDVKPRSAVIDLAGPVVGDAVPLTNAGWVLKPREMIAAAGLEDVIFLNDFEALAIALPSLKDDDLVPIGGGAMHQGAAKVVVGPGTGLGVGALVSVGGLAVPVPGEGGHIALGPDGPDEMALWPHLELDDGRIAAESLLAGRGIVRLYRGVAKAAGATPAFATPAEITEAALAGEEPIAVRTMALYCRLLGRVAGDIALVFMARGGVYIGGGIPPRILPILEASEFRTAFDRKAPHAQVMVTIPVSVIVRDNPALPGLAAFANAPDRFGVNLEGRRWRV